MKIYFLILFIFLFSNTINSQESKEVKYYVSNWQRIETNNGVTAGVSVYYFKVKGDSIYGCNKRKCKSYYAVYKDGKKYTSGDWSWKWTQGIVANTSLIHKGKPLIIIYRKNNFTGQYEQINYILKRKRYKK